MRTAVLLCAVVAAVSSMSSALAQLSDCDPLDPFMCVLPFPNNFWLRPSQAHGGANRLAFGPKTFPADDFGVYTDPRTHAIARSPLARNRLLLSARCVSPLCHLTLGLCLCVLAVHWLCSEKGGWNDLDGFSPIAPIVTYFANLSVEASKLPPYYDMTQSVAGSSPTILLDTATGQVVPHFAEVDHSSDDVNGLGNATEAYPRLLMMWPSSALQYGRRYIVAFRNLLTEDGSPVASSFAFACLRDGVPTNDPDIELRRPLFADLFARLTVAGWPQGSLTLAWDFTVGSRSSIVEQRMLYARDDSFTRMPPNGPDFSIRSIENNGSSSTARRIEATLMVPQYVNSPDPGATLVLDSNGHPVFQGFGPVNVSIWVPMSLAYPDPNQPPLSPSIFQYGHGLFGSRDEAGN
jgi:hypothetical protein